MISRSLILFISFIAAISPAYAQVAKRVITLSPHATELAFSAGLGDNIIAVSNSSDYPPQVKKLEKVANYQDINIERIIALKPDLIISWPAGNPPRALDKLRQFGFNVYLAKTDSLADIANTIDDLSAYAKDPSVGQKAAQSFRSQLQQLTKQYDTKQPVDYFYQLSDKPIITVAKNNWPSDVFKFCGGRNVFERASAPYPQVSVEQVLIANPAVFFTSPHATTANTMWNKWQDQLPAIAQHHIWTINGGWLTRPTMRTLNAVKDVCQHLQQVREKE